MYLIKTIFIVVGFLGLLNGLFNKHYVWEKIELLLIRIGDKLNIKLIFDLAFCMFCQRFWITVILTLIVSIFTGYNLETILVPFIAFGIYNIKQ